MKHPVVLLLCALAVGSLLTIAVAWALPLMIGLPVDLLGDPMDQIEAQRLWDRYIRADWPKSPEEAWVFSIGNMTIRSVQARSPTLIVVSEGMFGWPAHSLTFDFWATLKDGGHYLKVLPADLVVRPLLRDPGMVLPVGILWLGFLMDTLFYGLVVALLFRAGISIHRLSRLKRNLCPTCAYPMKGSVICSECGRKLPRRVRTAT